MLAGQEPSRRIFLSELWRRIITGRGLVGGIRGFVAVLALLGFAGAFFVDYAASIALFLLAAFGIVMALKNGASRYLGRREFYSGLAFAAAFVAAVVAYETGLQTNTGFQMLGRELRLVLFLPCVVAMAWSGLRQDHVAFAACAGAVGTLAFGLWQSLHGLTPIGVTGAHIVYGDGALLLGALGAALTIRSEALSRGVAYAVSGVSLVSGVAASLLSGARGGWIAIPVLAVLLALLIRHPVRRLAAAGVLLVILVGLFELPHIHHVVVGRATEAWQHYRLYAVGSANRSRPCPNDEGALQGMLRVAGLRGAGAEVDVVPARLRDAPSCRGGHAIRFIRGDDRIGPAMLSLYRASKRSGPQTLSAWVKGDGGVRAGWEGTQDKVSNRRFSRVRVSAAGSAGIPLQLIVWPGETLEAIPLQRYPGEYMDALSRSSAGNRFIMWQAAWGLYLTHPFLGSGFGSFEAMLKRMVQQNRLDPSVRGFDHPHSIYLNWMYGAGTLGLMALLLMLVYPSVALPKVSSSRGGAIVLVVGVALCGITESLFVHSLWISWFIITIGALAVVGRPREHQSDDCAPAARLGEPDGPEDCR